MEKQRHHVFIVALAIFAAITGLLFGYDTGVIAGAILIIKEKFQLTIYQQQLVVSIMLLAAAIATLISGWLTDKIGRHKIIILGAGLFTLGALFLTFSFNYIQILIGRVVIGLAIGISMTATPMYIAELAPPHTRGALVTTNQLFVTIGILIAFVMNYVFANVAYGWRWMFGLSIVPAITQLIAMLYFPESPRYLASKGKYQRALDILSSISSAHTAKKEVAKIKENLVTQKPSWKELLHANIWPAFAVSIALHSFQQLTGINAVIYYAPEIFLKSGLATNSAAILATIGIGIINVIMTIIAIFLLDRWGRRPLLLVGLAGMVVTLFVIGISFITIKQSEAIAIISIIALMAFVGLFAISLGPMPWLMPNEMLPTKVKGKAVSLAIFTNWFFNFVVSGTFLTMVQFSGMMVTFSIYAIIGILAWIFFYACLPETKNKVLEDIKVRFFKRKSSK